MHEGQASPERVKTLTHTCIHDEISHKADHASFDAAVRANAEKFRPDPAVLSTKRGAAAVGGIRVFANTQYLGANADNGYGCYAVGASVTNAKGNTYSCTANDIMNTTLINTLQNSVVPTAISVLNLLLSVDQVAGNFFVDSSYISNTGRTSCTSGIPIPSSLRSDQGGGGVANTDYYVWVTARPSDAGNLASALACNLILINAATPQYGRPLAGYINFNPSELRSTNLGNSLLFNRYVRVAIHEFMHVCFSFMSSDLPSGS